MACTWKDRLSSYLEPIEPLSSAAKAFFSKLWLSIRADGLGAFTRLADVRAAAVASWFRGPSEQFIEFEVRAGVPDLVASARGIVLELGPGTGHQLRRYDAAAVTFVYGVEPNRHFAPDVAHAVAQAGLQDKYELIPCGVEDSEALARRGITEGTLDTVLSIQVLCSVPQPEAVVRELYRLLKPGGQLIFWEHRRSSDATTAVVQGLWNWLWALGIGGCTLNRDLKKMLREAGEWENLDSLQSDDAPQSLLPRTWGRLVKKS
ncbi:Methyltransferase-like protein 7B [Tolypocladium ophioglossoides CBS 100239]|uniref:Methyltransferase-like protein 7B n=1 Tax=Tolypocladium ophioglossoides (strain CBS 100239) TaxID=1163406 RepID=A0A0L0NLF7_TOLOC|nr:Methyltransferase-like protein 7B [Tolypocladium ophioglossoides CBS 100239]